MRTPYTSPWGAVLKCIELCKGVFDVSAINGGGIMVHSSAAAFLSNIARRYALHEGVYLCYWRYGKSFDIFQRELINNKLVIT